MDVSAASGASAANAQDTWGIAVLKKSMDTEQAMALQLIQAMGAPEPGVGTLVDAVA